MQEGIKQIGKAVFDDSDFFSNIIKDISIKDRRDNPKYIIQLDFNTKKEKLEIKLYGEARETSSKELLWIGTADGPVSPQWYTTGNKLTYLISQTIPNLISLDMEGLSKKLKIIQDTFFYDMGEQGGTKERYRYVVDLHTISTDLNNNEQLFKEAEKKVKNAIGLVEKEIESYIKDKYDLKKDNIALYFLSIDGELISNNKNYRNEIKKEKLKAYEVGEEGTCSICGVKEGLTSDTSKLQLKFYTTTNLNFPSQFSKSNYNKNMLICKDCMMHLLTGEQFIIDNLRANLGGLQVYLIPHFLYDTDITKKDMEIISGNLVDTFNAAKKVEGILKLQGEIWDTLEINEESNYFLLNILFYKAAQQAVKVQRLIKDVHPSRFKIIIDDAYKVMELFRNSISNRLNIYFGLESVYYLTPVKLKQGEVKEYRKLLTVYDAIFKNTELDKETIIKTQVKLFKIHHFKQYNQYNIKSGRLDYAVVQSNMLLKYFEKIGCLKGGKGMDVSKLNVDEGLKNYINEMGFNEQETAMVLLGYLVGQVGNRQYNDRGGKKPILNKLNFNGMDLPRIKRLCTEIVDKLRQNKILKYNEKVYYDHKRLLDKNIKEWTLNKQDNLYYILSGYSYGTTKSMLRERNGNGEK